MKRVIIFEGSEVQLIPFVWPEGHTGKILKTMGTEKLVDANKSDRISNSSTSIQRFIRTS